MTGFQDHRWRIPVHVHQDCSSKDYPGGVECHIHLDLYPQKILNPPPPKKNKLASHHSKIIFTEIHRLKCKLSFSVVPGLSGLGTELHTSVRGGWGTPFRVAELTAQGPQNRHLQSVAVILAWAMKSRYPTPVDSKEKLLSRYMFILMHSPRLFLAYRYMFLLFVCQILHFKSI